MRESRDRYHRQRPTVSQDRNASRTRGEWRTLREASDITGIPVGTLRKWCRRETVESYLESDGDLTLRMVEMGSVRARAETSGREEVAGRQTPDARRDDVATSYEMRAASPESETVPEPATMIVPVDAWNKMLNQLGNLHEAGQQLAEARERAAKAETEATFLRERLAEMREVAGRQSPVAGQEEETVSHDEVTDHASSPLPRGGGGASIRPDGRSGAEGAPAGADPAETESTEQPGTMSFWRYVARGWRDRQR